MQTVQKMPHYSPQVDEPSSFVDGPPPAYPTKGYSVRLELIRLTAKTAVFMVAIVGAFVLLGAYIHTSTSSCSCSTDDFTSRFDADPLIAQPSHHEVKLQIGENLKDHKGKSHLDCIVERREQLLDAMPSKGDQRLQMKGEQTLISCSAGKNKGKRIKRSPVCDCSCAC